MRISQWGEYGIHFSVFIGRKEFEQTHVVGAAEISESQQIAIQYAQQILQRLRRGSIIVSVRGPHGGYRLARPPKEISLYDILLACEGAGFEVICETKPLNHNRCGNGNCCYLRNVWYQLRDHIDNFLKKITLEDLILIEQNKGDIIGTIAESCAAASNFGESGNFN